MLCGIVSAVYPTVTGLLRTLVPPGLELEARRGGWLEVELSEPAGADELDASERAVGVVLRPLEDGGREERPVFQREVGRRRPQPSPVLWPGESGRSQALPPGRYELSIECAGLHAAPREVQLRPESRTSIQLDLKARD